MLSLITAYAHPYLSTYAQWASSTDGIWDRQMVDLYLTTPGGLQTRLVSADEPGEQLWGGAFSPDGDRLAYVQERRDQVTDKTHAEIFTLAIPVGLEGKAESKPLTHDSHGLGSALPAWSPDGSRIAYFGGEPDHGDIFVMNADGSNPHRLTEGDDDDWGAAWSPDGDELSFVSDRGGSWAVWVMSADGSNPRSLTEPGGDVAWPTWMPDGKHILFGRVEGEGWDIHLVTADGAGERVVVGTSADERRPAIAPDGQKLYFISESSPNAQADIYSLPIDDAGNVPGDAERVNVTASSGLEEGGRHGIAVSPDGRMLAYSGTPNLPRSDLMLDFTPDLGAAGVLLQSAVLMGLLLAVVLRFSPPFGFFTIAFALNAALMSALGDNYRFIAVAAIGGLAADLLVRRLAPATSGPRALRLIAFAVPTVLYLAYFATFLARGEMGWAIHMWTGVSVAAGIVGWMLAELILLGRRAGDPRPTEITAVS